MDSESLLQGTLMTLGGLGLFLLGMTVMTEGLNALADDRLRKLLAKSTRSPISGVVTGMISTAMVQSSSATTVAAIGFVGAGLLTFPQALGIIYGANVGTSITGWLVVLLGFKMELGQMAFPLVLAGVLLRLFGRGWKTAVGSAIAGFGLLFVGIGNLQEGMGVFSDVVTPDSFPPDTFFGRLALVAIGLLVTIVTQSSSAALVMALTGVSMGNLSLAQSAAMTIGMGIGTTVTAMIATIGGTVQARRTGLAHLVYNLFIGVGSFLMLTPYLLALDLLNPQIRSSQPELALVAFYTLSKVLGVIAVLPVTEKFAGLIIRLVPERGNPLTQRLESQLLDSPELAVTAVQATVCELVTATFDRLAKELRAAEDKLPHRDEQLSEAIQATEQYLGRIHVDPDNEPLFRREQASLHILDHLRRLLVRLRDSQRIRTIREIDELREGRERLAASATEIARSPHPVDESRYQTIHSDYKQLKSKTKTFRKENIAWAAGGRHDTATAIERTDAARGLRRMGYHLWRTVRQLSEGYREPVEELSQADSTAT